MEFIKAVESNTEQNGPSFDGPKKIWQTPSVEAMKLMETETGPNTSEDGLVAGS